MRSRETREPVISIVKMRLYVSFCCNIAFRIYRSDSSEHKLQLHFLLPFDPVLHAANLLENKLIPFDFNRDSL